MTETTELTRVEELQAEIPGVVKRAEALAIVTPEDYEAAADALKANKDLQKRVDELLIAPWRKAKADAEANRKNWDTVALEPLRKAEGILKGKQLDWSREQERIRQAEQRRLQAIADEKARKERERAEALARAQREKEEAARRAEEEARARAAAAKNEEARAAAEAEAEKARKAAAAAAAKAAAREEAAEAVAPASVIEVASVAPKVKGQSVRKTWKARVIEAAKVPREWMVVNQTALDAFARSTKGAVPVAGVEMYEEETLASSGR